MNRFDNIDCMIGMKEYPDNHFDLAIVDPPYTNKYEDMIRVASVGGSAKSFLKEKKYANPRKYKYDSLCNAKPNDKYFKELFRISRNQIIWGVNWYKKYFGIGRIVWDKDNSGNFSDCELAYHSFGNVTRLFKYRWNGMLQEKMGRLKEERIHPTQKPIALYKWLLTKYAKQGDLILDTHVGSASSLIACEDMGFEYVGFELDEDYYNDAQKRLTQFRSQYKLAI